jgi:hypothetical protein
MTDGVVLGFSVAQKAMRRPLGIWAELHEQRAEQRSLGGSF